MNAQFTFDLPGLRRWCPRGRRSLGCSAWIPIGLLLTLGLVSAADGGEGGPESDPKAEEKKEGGADDKARREAFEALVKAGRVSFGNRDYVGALARFRDALAVYPESRYAALVAGVAAYWNREPRAALGYWTALAEKTQRGSPEEWQIMRHLVLAWHGVEEDDRAEECVRRLYELRSQVRLPQALKAKGFTRQHIWLGKRRVGVWEVFDERGELPRVWDYQVVEVEGDAEKELARLVVELEPRSDGKAGYALVENAEQRRVYKRWSVKPTYVEARQVALAGIKGQLKLLDAGASVAETAAGTGPAEPAKTEPAEPGKREPTPAERERLRELVALKLSPAATRILAVAARLTDVDFDVSRYVRLSVSDPVAARAFEAEQLTRRFPHATSDASDLVQYVASAQAADCVEAFKHVGVVVTSEKADYARYVLLTALNTRGGEPPVEYLSSCLGSADFVVRQTAALLLARVGRKDGLESLFKELASAGEGQDADEVSRIVSFYLEELLGPVLGPCPLQNGGPWREAALTWWKQNEPKLEHIKGAPAGQAIWRVAE